jgi:predicted dehydrogenase
MTIEASAPSYARPLRLGMVGGGTDAFIGAVHRIAARLDDQFVLVAGALSSTPQKALASGHALGLVPDRIYGDFAQMAKAEAARPDGIDAVAIVTPNHVHLAAAQAFLAHGIHVICDKPLTSSLTDAHAFVAAAEAADALMILTHNYTGYPVIRQARKMVCDGMLGKIRLVQVEYAQDWLTVDETNKQAEWRTDPARSGAGGATGDIGTHAINLAEFVTGLELTGLAADLQSFVPGRRVDDNAHVLLRFAGGARGMLWCSQVAPGHENGLKLRVYGATGGLEWGQENPNHLRFTPFGEPAQILTRAGAGAMDTGSLTTRVPAGHPEGYLEGFANIYADAARAIRAHQAGTYDPTNFLLPGVRDGLKGVQFVDACVRSSAQDAAWVTLQG